MARVHVCADCGGTGARTYERGRPVERCTACRGAGVVFADPATAARDARELVTAPAPSPELLALGPGGGVRALAAALELLEERLAAAEAELARRR
ncbi:MAG TPA: hypothetical protein VHC45_00600 [Gaiellaceae bacterium]|nr:hypothetical protein [Gaiellaceae bacterium]